MGGGGGWRLDSLSVEQLWPFPLFLKNCLMSSNNVVLPGTIIQTGKRAAERSVGSRTTTMTLCRRGRCWELPSGYIRLFYWMPEATFGNGGYILIRAKCKL
ncbi:hypothetical protein MTO96_031928 [Rhipicephalus appendiculatus]